MATTQQKEMVSVHLCGPFRILLADSTNITPNSMKAQALLALLASSPTLSCSRVWLQDKLWSNREKNQGSSSLRQALSEIRRCFADVSTLLIADRRSVSLDPSMVVLAPEDSSSLFLEGIDVRDNEFEEWLAIERMRRPDPNNASVHSPHVNIQKPNPVGQIQFACSLAMNAPLRPIEDLFVDGLARMSREMLGLQTGMYDETRPNSCSVLVRIRCFSLDSKRLALRASATDNQNNMLIWSSTAQAEMRGALPLDEVAFLRLGNELIEALIDHFSIQNSRSTDETDATSLFWLGLKQLFTMNEQGSIAADKLFEQAYERDQRGLFLAWRAHLRGIQIVERYAVDTEAVRETGRRFAQQAFQQDAMNSSTVAALANARLILDQDVIACDELAQRSIKLNPGNPMGWWSQSAAHMYGKDYEAAYQSARMASALAGSTPHKFWWDINRALTSSVTGRYEEALDSAKRAHALAPNFKPPLRVLLILQSISGDVMGARASARKLTILEPDFSLERLGGDPNYPVSLFRSAGLISQKALLDLK